MLNHRISVRSSIEPTSYQDCPIGVLGYFLSITPKVYTIDPPVQVRKNAFHQNRTFRGCRYKLTGIFFRFRTLLSGIFSAKRGLSGHSAPSPYSIHENRIQSLRQAARKVLIVYNQPGRLV